MDFENSSSNYVYDGIVHLKYVRMFVREYMMCISCVCVHTKVVKK